MLKAVSATCPKDPKCGGPKSKRIAPINRHTTIHWGALNVPNDRARAALSFLQKRMADFLNRRGCKFVWVLTWENPASKGLHTHMLWHLPVEPDTMLAYRRNWRRWRAEMVARYALDAKHGTFTAHPARPRARKRAVMTKRIGGSARAYLTAPALHCHALHTVLAYICKGAEQTTLDANGLNRQHEIGGEIIGKRASWWQMRA